jgi:hypothetical protein
MCACCVSFQLLLHFLHAFFPHDHPSFHFGLLPTINIEKEVFTKEDVHAGIEKIALEKKKHPKDTIIIVETWKGFPQSTHNNITQ